MYAIQSISVSAAIACNVVKDVVCVLIRFELCFHQAYRGFVVRSLHIL